ncbi:uncharacterized protein LOC6730262 [Drosophila simulans]|nr:uncharacterized protein LOC6730262 [Drosophila simulans]KMZ06918.1 uncharacterized protein Dsimw501_GD16869 [Drosophila simulans]
MDAVCQFLSADLYSYIEGIVNSLFVVSPCLDACSDEVKKNAKMWCQSCTSLLTQPSYTIRHHYPGPLVTYDGEARCEPRLIRLSDLTMSTMELIFQAYGDNDDDDDDDDDEMDEVCENKIDVEEKCDKQGEESAFSKLRKIFGWQTNKPIEDDNSQSVDSCRLNGGREEPDLADDSLTEKKQKLQALEDRARGIYETHIESSPDSPSWDCLKPAQKLRFQWKASTGDDLMKSPYENFTLVFTRSFLEAFPRATCATVRKEQKIAWWNLDRCQRMPFILQALLYQVAIGAIDPEDHCAVRELFHKLR